VTTVEASQLAEPFEAIMALAGRAKQPVETKKRPDGRVLGQSPLFEDQSSDDDIMVRSADCYWNQFYASLRLMHGKLTNLGLVDANGAVIYQDRVND
jgi:hypothetical protein